jgi:small subunit ribosomal protein S20
MPHHKSAAKRVKTNEKSRRRNIAGTSRVRSAVKAVRSAKTRTDANSAYQTAVSVLDRIAAKGIIRKETASRQKSRLAKYVQSLTA